MGFRDCWIEAGRPLPRETSKFNTRLGSILNSRASKIIIISQGKENILELNTIWVYKIIFYLNFIYKFTTHYKILTTKDFKKKGLVKVFEFCFWLT